MQYVLVWGQKIIFSGTQKFVTDFLGLRCSPDPQIGIKMSMKTSVAILAQESLCFPLVELAGLRSTVSFKVAGRSAVMPPECLWDGTPSSQKESSKEWAVQHDIKRIANFSSHRDLDHAEGMPPRRSEHQLHGPETHAIWELGVPGRECLLGLDPSRWRCFGIG